MHKDGKWARQILALQDEEGKWGCFHSLSQSYGASMTTEQALRRLEILGFTIADPCIQKTVSYMEDCLMGKKIIPDRREKVSDWDVFSKLILSTWIRRFKDDCEIANSVAEQWIQVISWAFSEGCYDAVRYEDAYRQILKPQYGRINGFEMFYPVSLVRGCLDKRTEHSVISHLLNQDSGIYYIYEKRLMTLPERFESREASRYLGAMELLSGYSTARDHLGFLVKWLVDNQKSMGCWDMGKSVNDKVHFPLSDDWRKIAVREADCSERIEKLLIYLN